MSWVIVVLLVLVLISVAVGAAVQHEHRLRDLNLLLPADRARQAQIEDARKALSAVQRLENRAVKAATRALASAKEPKTLAALDGKKVTEVEFCANGKRHPLTAQCRAHVDGVERNESRELYLVVVGEGWGEAIPVNPDKGLEARDFAAKFNAAALSSQASRQRIDDAIRDAEAELEKAETRRSEEIARAQAELEALGEAPLEKLRAARAELRRQTRAAGAAAAPGQSSTDLPPELPGGVAQTVTPASLPAPFPFEITKDPLPSPVEPVDRSEQGAIVPEQRVPQQRTAGVSLKKARE